MAEGRGGGGGEVRTEVREGQFLLGMPTFEEKPNGRFLCVETGHEVPSRDMIESYGRSKGCRLALIDAAVKNQKPPLNMFLLDPLSKSKLICKLTGDSINKSEEHIWKHVSGKKFLKKLDQEETEKKPMNSSGATKGKTSAREKMKDDMSEDSASEEPEFWVPPVGRRWDFDNGKDRWEVSDDNMDEANPDDESMELSTRSKRVSATIGPANSAPRKKKSRKKD